MWSLSTNKEVETQRKKFTGTFHVYSYTSLLTEDELNLLVIIVDTNPIWWGKQALKESQFTLSKCIDAVMVLGNSHLFMNRSNKLAVIASHIQESRFLYPGKNGRLGDFFGDPGNPSSEFNPSGSKDGKYELLTAANDVIAEEIKDLMTKSNYFQLFSIHYCYLQIESNVEVFEVSNPKI